MGNISKKLALMIKNSRNEKVISLKDYVRGKELIENSETGVKGVDELIKKGLDPFHALYVYAQNFTSALAEVFLEIPIFQEFYDIFTSTENQYLKKEKDMNPLTKSYFTTWAFFDVQFGEDNETIGTCIIDVSKELGISSEIIDIIKLFQDSRMGIYMHCGSQGAKVLFKELVTEKEYFCHVASGYLGEKGQFWFARVLPDLGGVDYRVIFTTPYILISTKRAWLSYFSRTLPKTGITDSIKAFNHLMKFGLNRNYWNDYILSSYHRSQFNVIFLSGVPDIKRNLIK